MMRRYKRNPDMKMLILGGGAIAAFLLWKKLGAMFKAGTINPASRKNVVYQAAGEPGLKIADWFKSAAERRVDEMLNSPVPRPAAVTTDVPADVTMTQPM